MRTFADDPKKKKQLDSLFDSLIRQMDSGEEVTVEVNEDDAEVVDNDEEEDSG